MGSEKKKDKKKTSKQVNSKKVEKEEKKKDKKKIPSPEPESDESSEEVITRIVPGASNSDSSDESSSSDSEQDDTPNLAKRKPEAKPTPPAKKAKAGGIDLTLFIGNLPFTSTKEELEEFLAECDVSEVRLVKDSNDGRFKGYAYADFNSEEGFDKALEYNGEDFNGRSIKIDRTSNSQAAAGGGATGEKSKTVFVGNLSWNTDDESLTNLFSECGSISSIRIITDKDTGQSKGFAYVEFEDIDAAEVAVSYHGTELDGRNLRINFETGNKKSGGDRGGGDRGFRGGGGFRGGRGGDRGDRRGGGGRGGGGFRGGDRRGGGGFGGRGGGRGGDRGGGGFGGRGGGRGRGGEFKGKRTTFD